MGPDQPTTNEALDGDAEDHARADTSVVITTCGNEPELLVRCINALLAQTVAPLEVIVVDNRPLKRSVGPVLEQSFPGEALVRIVEEPTPGLSRARNAGLAVARGEYVGFLDDDVIADPRWLAAARARFADHDDVVCVTGLIVPSELETPAQELFEKFAGFGKGLQSRTFRLADPPADEPLFPYTPGRFGSGANAVFRADVLRAMDGFDVALGAGTRAAGGEDVDMYLRVVSSGATLIYEPAAIVRHRHPPTFPEVRHRVFLYGVGLGAMLSKHMLAPEERPDMVRRVPRGLVYLFDPKSGKNRRKGAGFPRRLTLLELLGVLWGPWAYLRSRQIARSLTGQSLNARQAVEQETSVWCGEVWTGRMPGLPERVFTTQGGPYTHARLLVRDHASRPLGFVTLSLTDGRIDPAQVRGAVSREFGTATETDAGDASLPALATMRDAAVSIIVCTRDRAVELRRCIGALRALEHPDLEIIVVDNAPTDAGVQRAFREAAQDDPRFRYVVEPRPGLSCARNRGLRESRGAVIAFTDDDVHVDPDWISGILTGFARRPEVGCVTGLVASASLQTRAEQYFDARVWWSSSCQQRVFVASRGPADSSLHPYAAGAFGTGANMAFRREVLLAIGGFDERLGAGSPCAGGEDLDAFVRILRAGYALSYEPAALVWHEHRSDDAALRKQMYAYGKGLSAYATKYLLTPDTSVEILCRTPRALMHLIVLGRRSQSAAAHAGIARATQVAEVRGLIAGPAAYLRSR
ncbi:MAG: glycosyltransferase [Solirubrobacteraceae bacterium]